LRIQHRPDEAHVGPVPVREEPTRIGSGVQVCTAQRRVNNDSRPLFYPTLRSRRRSLTQRAAETPNHSLPEFSLTHSAKDAGDASTTPSASQKPLKI
jgi:hypothetical protein